MSHATRLLASLLGASAQLGGAHLTREARDRTMRRLVKTLVELGYTHLRSAADIAGRHLREYVRVRARVVSRRTAQNEVAHIRSVLRRAGRKSIADAAELSNEALGVSGGSRIGTKTAMTEDALVEACRRAEALGRPGLSAILLLAWELGLRANEALHARYDTLQRWQRELIADGRIEVLAGTKGGRRRVVRILDVQAAISVLQAAEKVASTQGGFLVVRADGRPAGSLQSARAILHAWSKRTGVQPHAARYAFAQRQLLAYVESGMSVRESLSAVALDLGHGSGRGRWVRSVYSR